MRLVSLFILLVTQFAFSQKGGKYPSLLWKITKPGIKKESYLYGTMHVSNRVAYHLSDDFFESLKKADVVGLETNPGEWLNNMELMGELGKSAGVGRFNSYGGNFYKNLFSIRFPDKQLYKSVLSFEPEIINSLLFRHSKFRENFQENTYIDLFIYQAASKLNKTVVSLEDYRKAELQARLAMVPDKEFYPDATLDEDIYNPAYYTTFEKIEDAYRRGDLDMLDSLTRLTESKNMQKYLLHERNAFFANTIDSIIKSGKTIFAGVGAAHLPGEKGLIDILRAMGYRVEPLTSNKSRKAQNEKDKIDKTFKSVLFEKNTVNDSLFSVQTPGKLRQIMDYEDFKYYIFPDMVNGNFYSVVRVRTNAGISNLDAEKISLSVDSLFFENIPGKIISKKNITNSGFNGYDIVNRTNRGDLQRYQLFFTDVEIVIFKLGGKYDYVNSTPGKQFFNSIKFEKRNNALVLFEPPAKGFKVILPADYSYGKNEYTGASGLTEDLIAFSRQKQTFYGVKHGVYNDFYYLEEDTFELNRLAKYTLKNFKYDESSFYKITSEQGFPCIHFSGMRQTKRMYGKIFIKGVHYYLVYSIGPNENSFDSPFFKSFQLTDFKHLNEIKKITDNDIYFSTMDEVSNSPSSRFNEEFISLYKKIKQENNPPQAKQDDFDYYSTRKNYYSPSNHEYVEIYFERYNRYDYKPKKDFIEKVNKNLAESFSMRLKPVRIKDTSGLFVYDFELKDTATVRAIKCKLIVKNACVYQVKVPFDTTIGLKGWAKQFFENFQLKDTIIGGNFFENKFGLLLSHLSGTDTTLRRQAEFSLLNSITMEKEYAKDFVDFIGSSKVDLLSTEAKAQLFVNGGVMEDERIVEPYKKLYNRYSDSAYIQLCLLKGLAYCRTKKSFQAFLELLKSDPPLVGDASVVGDVFNVLYDSLELCKGFYPALLDITSNNEYYEPIYRLLSVLIKRNIIQPQDIISKKQQLITEANSELKRYNAALNTKQKQSSAQINTSLSEDAAEQLKFNMRSLQFNQSVKNARYNDILSLSGQPFIVSFARIIAPFAKTDERAKQTLEKIAKIKSDLVSMPVYIIMKKANLPTNDSIAFWLSKNTVTRTNFYAELKKEGLEKHFHTNYATQGDIVEAVLKSSRQLLAFQAYEPPDKNKDSLILHKIIPAKNRYEKGFLYLYKSPKNKMGLSRWSVAFVPDTKGSELNPDVYVIKLNEYFSEVLKDEEIVNELLDEFSMQYRSRATISTYNEFNYID